MVVEQEVLEPEQEALEPELLTAPTVKWAAWQGAAGAAGVSNGVVGSNTGSGGQALGTFVTGDLYIVIAFCAAGGSLNNVNISGTGWTKIIDAWSSDLQLHHVVWWKNAGAGETGIYTIDLGGATGEVIWSAYNLGQPAYIDAWNGTMQINGELGRIPGCPPTSAQSLLITNWGGWHASAGWTGIPGGLTTTFNLVQNTSTTVSGLSATKTLSAAGTTPDLTATPPTLGFGQWGGSQIAIANAPPPNGGGGDGQIKWMAVQGQSTPSGTSLVIGSNSQPGYGLGSFANGDLYIVAALPSTGGSVDPGVMSISGTGWTTVAQPAPGVNIAPGYTMRLTVFAKNVNAGDSGAYTVNWTNNSTGITWAAWNYGQATIDAGAGLTAAATGTVGPAPSVTTTQANDVVLAAWFSPLNAITAIPTTITERANTLQLGTWGLAVGDFTKATAGATGALNATVVSGAGVAAFQLAMKVAAIVPPVVGLFPLFTPLLPPPLVGQGGGPPPTFPPTSGTAPVPIPPGVLVGPAITLPTVIAGKALIIFGTGSATAPTMVSWFPIFTTTFPAPTFVVSNVWTVPTLSGGVWTTHLPAQTATTPCVPTGGWGLPGPSGSGPGPPSYPTPPGTGLPHHDLNILATQAGNDNGDDPSAKAESAETPRRRRRSGA